MTVTGTPGTGTVTLNAATSGFQTFGAAFAANATVDVFITDGAAWEVARNCAYTHSGTTLTRGTFEASSTGAVLSLTSAAVVTLTLTAAQITDYDGLWASLGGDTISVTTTATATIGRMHVCTGTSADYTVTLPAAAGNAGRFIGVRMAPGLTRLVTIDGNASETINGASTRVMWANESALLSCDGAGWFKVAGASVAMTARIEASATQSFASGAFVEMTMGTVARDVGALTGTANAIVPRRSGQYAINTTGMVSDVTGSEAIIASVFKSNTEFRRVFRGPPDASQVGGGGNSVVTELTAGDVVKLRMYGNVGSPITQYIANISVTSLALVEMILW